jgi:polysaccharide export outer membrane protein
MGRIIAILAIMFGASLALSQESVAQEYRIKPGDTLRIEVIEDPNLNRSTLVLPDGRISVPQAGTIVAGGRTVQEVQAEVAARLAPNFAAAPNVFVGVETLAPRVASTGNGSTPAVRTISVYVMGEAATPGKLDVKRGSTILQVLAQSGLSKFAATKRLQLRRGSQIIRIDYHAIENGAAEANPIVLQEGDVIVIPQRRLFE